MNQLKVNQQTSINALHEQGWSKRRIARELRLDRVTVRKYIAAAKSPGAQTGSEGTTTTPAIGLEPITCDRPQLRPIRSAGGGTERGQGTTVNVLTAALSSLSYAAGA